MADTVWTGADGTTYAYKKFEPTAPWNDASGNYIFAKLEASGWVALYIGETESFAQRLTPQHEKWKPAINLGMTSIFAHTGNPDNGVRMREEQNLIRHYQPPPQ